MADKFILFAGICNQPKLVFDGRLLLKDNHWGQLFPYPRTTVKLTFSWPVVLMLMLLVPLLSIILFIGMLKVSSTSSMLTGHCWGWISLSGHRQMPGMQPSSLSDLLVGSGKGWCAVLWPSLFSSWNRSTMILCSGSRRSSFLLAWLWLWERLSVIS